jgi:hypothetical protein
MLIEKALINAMLFSMITIGIQYRKSITTVVIICPPFNRVITRNFSESSI